jgi:hypothetical protein
MTNVLRSSHQNLRPLILQICHNRIVLPFGLWIFPQTVSDCINLLPTLSPLVCVSFLCAHINNLQIVSPSIDIFSFISNTVPLNRPFSWPLPLHNATSLVCCKYDDELFTSSQMLRSAVIVAQSYIGQRSLESGMRRHTGRIE